MSKTRLILLGGGAAFSIDYNIIYSMVHMAASSGLFADQVAVVTGGAQGLGLGISRMLAENGAKVIIFDMNSTKGEEVSASIQREGYYASFQKVDVSDEDSVASGFESVSKEHGRLDIAVNCAGIVGPHNITTEQIEVNDFDLVYRVNVRGSFLITKHALKLMKPRNYGRILLIASIAGKEGNPGMSPYSTSKAAVIGLVKSTGKEFAESGITVNALAPAVVRTPMVEAMKQEQVKALTDKIPKKRCCTVEEVAAITKFIVSKEASFNTGYCFDLTGGRATY